MSNNNRFVDGGGPGERVVDLAIACRQIYLDWNWLCPGIDTAPAMTKEYGIGRESPVQEDDEFYSTKPLKI